MGYVTPSQLVTQFGPKELAVIARPDDAASKVRITGELLRLTVDGGDRSAFSQAERDKADAILARMADAISRASQLMDSYIQLRHTIPLSATMIAANPLSSICGAIVRFFLSDDFATDETRTRHEMAIRWLKDLAKGDAILVDPDANSGGSGSGGAGGPPGFAAGVSFFSFGSRGL